MKKLLIILPAYNEEKVIGKVLFELKSYLKKIKDLNFEIVVIDDASTDCTKKKAASQKIKVLSHPINRGLGGALFTGFEYAKLTGADFLLTMDSDGQHDPKDIGKILKLLLENKTDAVIGVRNIQKMPFDRKIITLAGSLLTFLLFGVWCDDTQSGFRAFNKEAIKKIQLKTQRMEVSSEFFNEIKRNKLKFAQVPIRVIYTNYSRAKGQSNLNSGKVLVRLFLRLSR